MSDWDVFEKVIGLIPAVGFLIDAGRYAAIKTTSGKYYIQTACKKTFRSSYFEIDPNSGAPSEVLYIMQEGYRVIHKPTVNRFLKE